MAQLASRIFDRQLFTFGSGELKSGGHRRSSIFSRCMEAIIAAIYLDDGFETCRKQVCSGIHNPSRSQQENIKKMPKTKLQELLQARKKPLPIYKV